MGNWMRDQMLISEGSSMRLSIKSFANTLFAGFFLTSVAAVSAQEMPPIIGCDNEGKKGTAELALLRLTGTVANTELDCPLLQERKPMKMVKKFGETTLFAYPLLPYTCFSGDVSGHLSYLESGQTVQVSGTVYSAQRFFPVPEEQGEGGFGLGASSILGDLSVGAAMTYVEVEFMGDSQNNSSVLLDDHFLASATDYGTVSDSEDFLIVGGEGTTKLSGRLAGRGELQLDVIPPENLLPYVRKIKFDEISGLVCVRQ
jgi:hypothetical protein